MGKRDYVILALLVSCVLRRQVLRRLFLLLLAAIASVRSSAQVIIPRLEPRVDQRVELLSIVFRLAGDPEYNMSQLDHYTTDIDTYFGTFKAHPAVLLAKKLSSENGLGFDAVMAMAVYLSPPPSLTPLVPFTAIPERR